MFFRSNWPGLAWAVFILVLSGIPGSYIPHVIRFRDWLHPDKIVHLVIYAVFVLLLLRGFYKLPGKHWLNRYAIHSALAIGIIFGFITEVLQVYVFIGRNGNIYDWAADIAGCMIGWLLHRIFFGSKKRIN